MIFKNKRSQVNDTVILLILAAVFIVTALVIPKLQIGFGSSIIDDNNVDSVIENLNPASLDNVTISCGFFICQSSDDLTPAQMDALYGNNHILGASRIIGSIFLMFFWSFSLPIWVETVFVVFRLIFWFIIFRSIRGNGG